jgi:hypothetical protein
MTKEEQVLPLKDEVGKQLRAPFEEGDIKWRVQTAGLSSTGKPYVMAIPYISNRAVQKRLDDVFGVFGWEDAYQPTPGGNGWLCGITIHSESRSVTKWDGADNTNIESLKGGLSGSMKRAAVQLGIGRYLYNLKEVFCNCEVITYRNEAEQAHKHKDKRTNLETLIGWEFPSLPDWALPFEDHGHFIKPIAEAKDLGALRTAYQNAYRAAEASQNATFKADAIDAKDKRKDFINENIASIHQGKVETVMAWLKNEMAAFKEFPSKMTVDAHAKRIKVNLAMRVKAEGVDPKEFTDLLNKTHKARLTKINGSKK